MYEQLSEEELVKELKTWKGVNSYIEKNLKRELTSRDVDVNLETEAEAESDAQYDLDGDGDFDEDDVSLAGKVLAKGRSIKKPTSNNTKKEIKKYLDKKEIEYTSDMLKDELLELVE